MRILHTESSCGWGGQELRILEESRGMIARGHEVALVCPAKARILAQAPRFDVPGHALPIGRKRLRGIIALRRWLAAHPVDVINTHSSTDSWLAALACATRAKAPPIVRTRHISAPVTPAFGSRWLYGRAVAHLVTTGEVLRQTLVRELGLDASRVTSVPTGIDPSRFSPGNKTEARHLVGLGAGGRYVGVLATLRSWKGHLFLLEAFAQLGLPDWTLVIVGDGPMGEPIRAKIAELGLGERVALVGQQEDPQDWLRAFDIFCLPSYANEGVPQALTQAMLSGLPIVTTPVGAILEAVADGETALLVSPRDAGALAAAIRRLACDPALAARLGAAARERALARFSRAAMLDRMESIFRAVIAAER
ncbi:MAG: glycosyltransferase family 4 protein [Betaproteobacteria bacterium]|nr:glycosyltransferase family 4 protein [Betaproteobacteria bacterium]